MNIIDECMESLGENVHVLSNDNKEQVLGLFESTFPFTEWGRIEWGKVSNHAEVDTHDEVLSFLYKNMKTYSNVIYIIWDEGTLPII